MSFVVKAGGLAGKTCWLYIMKPLRNAIHVTLRVPPYDEAVQVLDGHVYSHNTVGNIVWFLQRHRRGSIAFDVLLAETFTI